MNDKSYSLAWDLDRTPESGPSYQPWRAYWPPKSTTPPSEAEIKEKPWLTWKRDPTKMNDKPWYAWVNEFTGEVDVPCDAGCDNCGGRGCVSSSKVITLSYTVLTPAQGVCSTVAEGG